MPTIDEILNMFIAICPNFKEYWEAENEDWRDENGTISYCGLFTLISRFVRENFGQMPPPQQKELMEFIESCVVTAEDEYNDLDNAVCTCFLENLSGEGLLSAQLRTYMGPNSLAFFNHWDFPAST